MTENSAETPSVRFNVLGSLECWVDDERIGLGGPTQERVLTALLLETGNLVSVSRLVDSVWETDPPTTAAHQIRKAVADLRRRIPGGRSLIVTDGPGYRIILNDRQLDLRRFTERTQTAKALAAEGRSGDAAAGLRAALDLWHGPSMSQGCGPALKAAMTNLEERRLTAAELFFELQLALGEASELIGDLRELVAAHPLREGLRELLMLALYRCGRQADALEEYARIRELLADELGIDPGTQLGSLYERILHASPELEAPAPPASPFTAPCTLPYDLTDFAGRETELRSLLELADRPGRTGTRIIAVDGMGGCGKTTLAVRAAHRLADDYPDGQLYIDLHGYTPGEQPLSPGQAIGTLLRVLGVPDDRIPDDTDGRVAVWRSTLAGRRVLLLLDNAHSVAQIRPLLPPSPASLVLVTSRVRLVDLDGVCWISLGMMPPEESASLLRAILGAERTAESPEATAELAELCGHLPLALQIATTRLSKRPKWTVRYFVDRLRDETLRLSELSSGERSVAAIIGFSYQSMDTVQRRAFRLLGVHCGNDVDVYSVAALLGTTVREAEEILEHLLDTHLVQQHEIDLYRLHDLVRSFTHGLRDADTERDDHEAFQRLVGYYLAASEEACRRLFPGRVAYDTDLPGPVGELPGLTNTESIRRWFDRERKALINCLGLAAERGCPRHAVFLARNLAFYLHLRGYLQEYLEVSHIGTAAARELGDPLALRVSLSNLAAAQADIGMFREAIVAAEESLELATSLGDEYGQAFSLDLLGLLHSDLGNIRQAQHYLEAALALHRSSAGHRRRQATVLCNLSSVYAWLGHYAEAAENAATAARLARELGDREQEVASLNDLAIARIGLGEFREALTVLDQALQLSTDNHVPQNRALTLALSADVCDRLGLPERAPGGVRLAMELARSKGTVMWQARVANVVGRVRRRQGAYTEALSLHESAYGSASEIGLRIEMARALDGLAKTSAAFGDETAAARYREDADELFAHLGITDARFSDDDFVVTEMS